MANNPEKTSNEYIFGGWRWSWENDVGGNSDGGNPDWGDDDLDWGNDDSEWNDDELHGYDPSLNIAWNVDPNHFIDEDQIPKSLHKYIDN